MTRTLGSPPHTQASEDMHSLAILAMFASAKFGKLTYLFWCQSAEHSTMHIPMPTAWGAGQKIQ